MPWARRLGSFWGPFGYPFWDQIGPRGAKMGPRGPSRGAKKRKRAFAQTLKNHCFSLGFWGPRPSKTASQDPRKLPRRYLGLLRAILSHLGGHVGTKSFQDSSGSLGPCPRPTILEVFGVQFGGQNSLFVSICWGRFLDPFLGIL